MVFQLMRDPRGRVKERGKFVTEFVLCLTPQSCWLQAEVGDQFKILSILRF